MSNHQKRLSVPKSWPVERKTETYTVKAGAGPHGEDGVPLLIILRDVLGYVDSKKEARYALDQDNVVINGTSVSDERRPVGMFDIVAFTEREEYYRVFPGEGGRLALTPIDAESAGSKLGKIVDKRHVPGGDVQLTLHDGQTLLVEEDSGYNAGDSLVVAIEDADGIEEGDIVAHFVYEEGALVTAVDGTHAGQIGTIEETQITPGSAPNNVIATGDDGDGDGAFETIEEYVVVIDENFTSNGEAESEETETESEETETESEETSDESEETETESEDADSAEQSSADSQAAEPRDDDSDEEDDT